MLTILFTSHGWCREQRSLNYRGVTVCEIFARNSHCDYIHYIYSGVSSCRFDPSRIMVRQQHRAESYYFLLSGIGLYPAAHSRYYKYWLSELISICHLQPCCCFCAFLCFVRATLSTLSCFCAFLVVEWMARFRLQAAPFWNCLGMGFLVSCNIKQVQCRSQFGVVASHQTARRWSTIQTVAPGFAVHSGKTSLHKTFLPLLCFITSSVGGGEGSWEDVDFLGKCHGNCCDGWWYVWDTLPRPKLESVNTYALQLASII